MMDYRHILVVEDEYLVAMDIERILLAEGAADVFLATSVKSATDFLEGHAAPDCVLLDVSLGDGSSFDLAFELLGRGIPFGFITGYSDSSAFPAELKHSPLLGKPFDDDDLIAFVRSLFADDVRAA